MHLSGPTICGLYGMFEADFGDPETSKPYSRITPSRIGKVLLPFHCPRCESAVEFGDAKTREHFHDTRTPGKDYYWCPTCGNRFILNLAGKPFAGEVSDGVAPSTVENIAVGDDGMVRLKRQNRGGIIDRLFRTYIHGTDILGCC